MAGSEQGSDRLLVMVRGSRAFVRVIGRGSFKVSTALKEFAATAIEGADGRLVLEMSACTGMDSTFMGVLAGVAMRLNRSGNGGRVALVNLAPKNRDLLATLGLDLLVDAYTAGQTPDEYEAVLHDDQGLRMLEENASMKQRTAETMLEAHEDLVRLSPDNLPKFQDVLQYLREDVRRRREGGGPP